MNQTASEFERTFGQGRWKEIERLCVGSHDQGNGQPDGIKAAEVLWLMNRHDATVITRHPKITTPNPTNEFMKQG